MEKSKVFFTDLRTVPGNDLLTKLEKLIRRAGIADIDFDGKFTAIKIHFGEPGNLAYIRPNYAARVVDVIRSLGGKPFLTDSNTLYTGGRSNAVDHLNAAMENGFNRIGAHADVIIADEKHSFIFFGLCKYLLMDFTLCVLSMSMLYIHTYIYNIYTPISI